jgi:pimeloyl-ACP methyl ester carboxylesterase
LAREGFRSFAFDLRGHGDSSWAPDAAYAMSDYADDLRAISAEVGRPALWVGASMGGIATLCAAGEPPPVAAVGVVLVDVSTRLREEGIVAIVNFMRSTVRGFDNLGEIVEAITTYLPHRKRGPSAESLAKNVRRREDGRFYWHWDPGTLHHVIDRDLVDRRLEAAAARITVPTALLLGHESELVTRESADNFMRRFVSGRVIGIPGARHMVAGDENGAFTEALIGLAKEWTQHHA